MSWCFDEGPMDGVLELNWGLPVALVDTNDSAVAIAARTDPDAEPVLIDLASLISWLRQHRPDLLDG